MLRSVLCSLLSISLMLLPLGANAAVIGTGSYVADELQPSLTRDAVLEQVQRADVREQLRAMGVEPAAVEQRLQNLTEAELASLNNSLAELPAGAGIVGVVGVVFIVLLILELVGVTNIFTSF